MAIHPTAIVDPTAEIDPSVEIGPYCVVGGNTKIGAGTTMISHVVVHSYTHIGERNTIYPFASVGAAPQDLKFGGEPSLLIIGDDNVIREGATLNRGTEGGGMETRVGNGCLLMAYSHVAHDCIVGNHVILANCVSLAGHVTLEDHVIIGGLVGVHQFCRIGRYAFLAGGAMITRDVLPFTIAQGDRAEHSGLNIVGLKRAGWDKEAIKAVRAGYQSLFYGDATREQMLERTQSELAPKSELVAELCNFARAAERGLSPARNQNTDSPS